MLVPVVLPVRATVKATLPEDEVVDVDEEIETVDDCSVVVTVTVAVALLTVVPLDGLDSATEKVRSLTCEALFRIGTVIVLDVSPAANESVPVVAV